MNARTLSSRGNVVPDEGKWQAVRDRLTALARQFPAGTRIAHACGRQGIVTLDQPEHVPGAFDGRPTTVCLTGEWHDEPMVFAHWDNDSEISWGVWVPAFKVHTGSAAAVNRPGNTARIGGRR